MKRTFKRTIAVMLAVLLICAAMPLTVFASDTETSGTCGSGVNWSFNSITGTLAITSQVSGGGTMDNYDSSNEPGWSDYSKDITRVTVNGVKKLGDYAFWNLENLTEVDFQDNKLATIGIYEFFYCESLTELTFPSSLENIGAYAFRESGIKRLTFTGNTLASAAENQRQAFRSIHDAEIFVPEGFKLAGVEATPEKYGEAPFFMNYVGYTTGDKATVYWMDKNDNLLKGETVEAGETPSYTPETAYDFNGWDPEVVPAEAGEIYRYTALYKFIDYVNAKGEAQDPLTSYVMLSKAIKQGQGSISLDASVYGTTWFIADTDISYDNRLEVNGNVNLLLCDGATFTLPKGITVNEGNSLTIWWQAEGSGALVINNVPDAKAGIGGGGYLSNSGEIIINGGNITATVIDGDDQSKTYTYSVRDYANYLLAHTDVEEYAEAAPLVRAMLTYGENAEYYFDKTGDEPADLDVNIPEFTRTVYDMPEGVTYSGATLSLKSETTLSIYFNSETEPTLTCTDQDITYETDKTDTNEYVIRIRGIVAYDLEKQFTVYVNGTKAVDYSPLRYCYMAQNSDDAKLSNTVKALYLYWFEAEKYFV